MNDHLWPDVYVYREEAEAAVAEWKQRAEAAEAALAKLQLDYIDTANGVVMERQRAEAAEAKLTQVTRGGNIQMCDITNRDAIVIGKRIFDLEAMVESVPEAEIEQMLAALDGTDDPALTAACVKVSAWLTWKVERQLELAENSRK